MPLPINPPPRTPTFSIFFIEGSTLERFRSNLSSRQPRSRSKRAEQPGGPLELAMLQSIENLLERELDAGKDPAVCARHLITGERAARKREDRRAGGDEQRQVGDDQPEADNSAGGGSHCGYKSSDPDATRPAGVNVGVESHYDAGSIDREHRC